MTDKVEALRVASFYHDKTRFNVHYNKSEAVKELAAFGLFSPLELSIIFDTTVPMVKNLMGWHTNMSWPQRVWNIKSINAIYLLALDYRRGHLNIPLLKRLLDNNNSVRAIAELTDIPIERIREVLLD